MIENLQHYSQHCAVHQSGISHCCASAGRLPGCHYWVCGSCHASSLGARAHAGLELVCSPSIANLRHLLPEAESDFGSDACCLSMQRLLIVSLPMLHWPHEWQCRTCQANLAGHVHLAEDAQTVGASARSMILGSAAATRPSVFTAARLGTVCFYQPWFLGC